MKFLKKILNATEIVAKEYTVLYYNEDTKGMAFKKGSEPVPPVSPEITITVEDALDTDIIALTATKNETVLGEITWSCNLASDVAEINGATLVFKQHYEGSVVLTATADNASDEKIITVTCEEVATGYTYSVRNVSSPSVNWNATSATINFTGVTTVHYALKADTEVTSQETQTVTFEQNKPQGDKPMQFTANTEFVDLGLPSGLKWAKCNLGATEETEAGAYFAWGDTVGYAQPTDKGGTSTARDITDKFLWNDAEVNYTVKQDGANCGFIWATAPFNNGKSSWSNTYFTSVSGDVLTTKEGEQYPILKSQYDAVTANLGEGYRMPTKADYEELKANTTSTWFASGNTEFNGVAGRKFTSKTDSSKYIFIPAAGLCNFDWISNVGTNSYVWSSSLYTPDNYYAYYLNSYKSGVGPQSDGMYGRSCGRSVRGVRV